VIGSAELLKTIRCTCAMTHLSPKYKLEESALLFGKRLRSSLPIIGGRVSACDAGGKGTPVEPSLALKVCRESFRWGEPHLLWQDEETFLLGIALSQNQELSGGILIHDVEVPENMEAETLSLLLGLAHEWMTWLVSQNLVNEALMTQHRIRGKEERFKAEAIHEMKAEGTLELRNQFSFTEPELLLAVRRGDRPEARKLLNYLIMHAYNLASHDFHQVRALLAELVALLRATARECAGNDEHTPWTQKPFWEILREIEDEEDLSHWLRSMLENTMDFIETSTAPPGKLRAKLVLDFIRLHCVRPLARKEVAGKAGLSEAEFSRMMKRETGKTFSDHLNAMRVDQACKLLRSSPQSIQEIAYACGFEEASYFSAVFRKYTGKSPKAFRLSQLKIS
jgi:AraC-like DNA-binding protein